MSLLVIPFYLVEISHRWDWGIISNHDLGDRTTSATTDRDFALKYFITIFQVLHFSLFEKFMAISERNNIHSIL